MQLRHGGAVRDLDALFRVDIDSSQDARVERPLNRFRGLVGVHFLDGRIELLLRFRSQRLAEKSESLGHAFGPGL